MHRVINQFMVLIYSKIVIHAYSYELDYGFRYMVSLRGRTHCTQKCSRTFGRWRRRLFAWSVTCSVVTKTRVARYGISLTE